MRVIVNAECVYRTRAGIGHHTGELVRCLQARAGDAIGVYPSGRYVSMVKLFARLHEGYRRAAERPGLLARAETLARGGCLAALHGARRLVAPNPFARCARRGGYQLYHEPNFLAHPCDLPTVVTVHDLSVLFHPEWHPARRVTKFRQEFDRTLRRACHLLTVSEAVKREIVRHLGWPAEKVTVAYNGRRPFLRPLSPDECAPVLRALDLKPGYLLHVGTVEPRKNLGLLLKAHAGLPREVRERHPLVFAGGGGWRSHDLETEVAARAKDGTARRLGYCPDEYLAALYSSARALVFPTLYEGFGMPTVEMMACGGAVLASTADAVSETVGGKAHLIDPHDEIGWRDAMVRACTDDDWWKARRAGAEDAARPYTWERCADDTLTAYRAALGRDADVKRAA